jgi:Ca2+/Na+ antiporter
MKSKIKQLLVKNKFYLILILIIAIVFIWAKVKMNSMEKAHAESQQQLIENYELTIENLNIENIEMTMKVFTWAIRSEMLRENTEQVNQFFIDLIQEPTITNLKVVDPSNYEIIISTDKKEEGLFFKDEELIGANDIKVVKDSIFLRVANPVMGLNKKLGILIAEIRPLKFSATKD